MILFCGSVLKNDSSEINSKSTPSVSVSFLFFLFKPIPISDLLACTSKPQAIFYSFSWKIILDLSCPFFLLFFIFTFQDKIIQEFRRSGHFCFHEIAILPNSWSFPWGPFFCLFPSNYRDSLRYIIVLVINRIDKTLLSFLEFLSLPIINNSINLYL